MSLTLQLRHLCKFTNLHLRSARFLSTVQEKTGVRKITKQRAQGYVKKNFIDYIEIKANGGNGGNGCIAFNQIFCNPRAGPGGGDGGNGGHVILCANSQTLDLSGIGKNVNAPSGTTGIGSNMHGKAAEHKILKVPVGTQVVSCIPPYNILADLAHDKQSYVVARGGAGGKGNAFFLSQNNRVPRVAEVGAQGESVEVALELKIVAAIGMLGFPNAGKSTLLRAISRARPKVAAYPFTTLTPMIGVVHFEDLEQMTVADLPGLIRGAHQNHGLGFDFLRHVERCRCLLMVIDLSEEKPWEQVSALREELELYQSDLSKRPLLVVANKVDIVGAAGKLAELRKHLSPLPVLPVSAQEGTNITEMLILLRNLHDRAVERENIREVKRKQEEITEENNVPKTERHRAAELIDNL